MFKKASLISKSLVTLLMGLIAWGGLVVSSSERSITGDEWKAFAGAFGAALMVWLVPNKELVSVKQDDRGAVNWIAVAAIAIIVLVVVILIASYDFSATEK